MLRCVICHAPLATTRRKYCSDICTKEAIRRWKGAVRERTRKLWLSGLSADPPWMDGWKTLDARRAYYRDYMRRRRRAQDERNNPVAIGVAPQHFAPPSSPSESQKRVRESGVGTSSQNRATATAA